MSKNCEFKDYPFCTGDCFSCYWDNVIKARLEVLVDSIYTRKDLDDIFRDKVKKEVDKNRTKPTERSCLEVSKNSLYHILKRMDKDASVIIDFFINDNFRFSSEGLELYKVEECLNFLPDDLIASNCELVSDGRVTRIKVII